MKVNETTTKPIAVFQLNLRELVGIVQCVPNTQQLTSRIQQHTVADAFRIQPTTYMFKIVLKGGKLSNQVTSFLLGG